MWDMIKTQFHFPSGSQFLWKNYPCFVSDWFSTMCRSSFDGTLSTIHVRRQKWSLGRNGLLYILHHLHNTIYITFFKATLYIQTTSLCHQISSLTIRTFKFPPPHFLTGGRGRYGKYRNTKNVMSTLQQCSECLTAHAWIHRRLIAVSQFRH